jgi:hypothetical protein
MAGRQIGRGPGLDAGGIDPFATNTLTVLGIKETLKELNKVDKSLRREITKRYKSIVQGVIEDAKSMIPLNYPLRNWKYEWKPGRTALLPWGEYGDPNNSIRAKINTKKTKEYAGEIVNVGTFVIRWDDPAAALFDFAENGVMGRNLTTKYGSTSRVMWKAWGANQTDVLQRMQELVNDVQKGVQQGIDRIDATKVGK